MYDIEINIFYIGSFRSFKESDSYYKKILHSYSIFRNTNSYYYSMLNSPQIKLNYMRYFCIKIDLTYKKRLYYDYRKNCTYKYGESVYHDLKFVPYNPILRDKTLSYVIYTFLGGIHHFMNDSKKNICQIPFVMLKNSNQHLLEANGIPTANIYCHRGNPTTKYLYHKFGVLHNKNGPSYMSYETLPFGPNKSLVQILDKEYYFQNNMYHRDENLGPSQIIYSQYHIPNIYKEVYHSKNKKQRINGPALICYNISSHSRRDNKKYIQEVKYMISNKIHRDTNEGPAYIFYDQNEEPIRYQYWNCDMLHNVNGPAVVNFYNGDSSLGYKIMLSIEYFKYNKLHRIDGPAIININKNKNNNRLIYIFTYYINDEKQDTNIIHNTTIKDKYILNEIEKNICIQYCGNMYMNKN